MSEHQPRGVEHRTWAAQINEKIQGLQTMVQHLVEVIEETRLRTPEHPIWSAHIDGGGFRNIRGNFGAVGVDLIQDVQYIRDPSAGRRYQIRLEGDTDKYIQGLTDLLGQIENLLYKYDDRNEEGRNILRESIYPVIRDIREESSKIEMEILRYINNSPKTPPRPTVPGQLAAPIKVGSSTPQVEPVRPSKSSIGAPMR